jgi:hypothetical protein
MCIDEHENMLLLFGGCGFQNLIIFLLFYFIYQNQTFFGIRLGFD